MTPPGSKDKTSIERSLDFISPILRLTREKSNESPPYDSYNCVGEAIKFEDNRVNESQNLRDITSKGRKRASESSFNTENIGQSFRD